jgi:hypothetical protein
MSSVIAGIVYRSFSLDIVSVILFFLGRKTAAGNRGSAGWSIGLTAVHSCVAVGILILVWSRPAEFRIGGRPVSAESIPWILLELVAILVWAMINIGLLVRARRTALA